MTLVGHGPDGSASQRLRTAAVSPLAAVRRRDRPAVDRLHHGRDGHRAGPGDPDDVRAADVVGDAELQQLRRLAEPAHAVGVEELQARLAAAGEPAEGRPVRRGRCPRGARDLHGLEVVAPRLAGGGELADEGVPPTWIGEAGVLAHGVDAGAGGVLRGVDHAPSGSGDHADHLRQAQQHLLGDRFRRRLGIRCRGGLLDPAPDDEQASGERQGEEYDDPADGVHPTAAAAGSRRWTEPGGVRSPRRSGRAARWQRGPPRLECSVSLQKERLAASSWSSIRAALSPSSRPMPGVVKPARWASSEGPALLVGQVVQGVQHVLLLGAQSLLPMPQPGDVPSLRHRPRARAHPLLGVGQAGHLAPVVAGGLERVADRAARRGQVTGERVGLQDQASAARQVELVEVRPGSGSWRRVRKWTRNPAWTGLDRWACQTEANPRASRGWSPSWDRMGRQ